MSSIGKLPTLWKGTSFLSIDPGINHTGFALYRVDMQGDVRLKSFGAISIAKDDLDDLERAGQMVDSVMGLVSQARPAFMFLERPPNTIYDQGKCHPGGLIARAQSVFKVVGVAYSIAARTRTLTGFRVFPVEPVKWQERSKAKRGGLSVKDWSLKLANSIITSCSDEMANLHTDKDENTADAISLGYICFTERQAG